MKHTPLTTDELATLTLEQANAIVEARNQESKACWHCTVDEFKAFYALGVRNFAWIDLHDADLRYADLSNTNLSRANLSNANLRDADLRYADLSDADLHNANLSYANLRDADLHDANLSYANLRDADLRYADLHDANLSYANLRDADLSDANVWKCEPFWSISNIGSRKDTLIAWHQNGILHLHTGCQQDISVEQFRSRLVDSSEEVKADYENALQFLERRLARVKAKEQS